MTSKLQSLTESWQEFDLPGTQHLLDDLATEITTRQDGSDLSRKTLIELIRNFKKSNSEEVRLSVAPLLKNFQNEIDNLSKRSKAAEKSFFDIYKKFCDIADPVPTLEYCMETMKSLQKMQDLEIENKQLRETLSEYNLEIIEYKGKVKKLDETENKLEEYEKNMEKAINDKVTSKEQELKAVYDDKEKNIKEDNIRNEQKMSESDKKCKELNILLDECQTELFNMKSLKDEKRNTVNDEIDLLMTDLDRANQRAITAEKELNAAQEKLSEIKEMSNNSNEDKFAQFEEASELRVQLNAKEREVIQLIEDIQKSSRTIQEVEMNHTKKNTEIEKQLTEAVNDKHQLENKLETQMDYQTIKKDLEILKTLEFPSYNPDEADNRSLEVLMLERSKGLQSENSMLRMDKERLMKDLTNSQSELSEVKQTVDKQMILITQLEEHVEQLQTISTPYREEAEGRSSAEMLADVLNLDSETEDVFSPGVQQSLSPTSDNNSSTLLPIVQAQRERFRIRNEELETTALENQQKMSLMTRQVSDLQTDNVKLYEKIRYLQSAGGRDVSVSVETVNKYQTGYEQRLDPFHSFGQAERQRKYGQLSVFEKVILSLVRFIANNKTARFVVFFYSVLLHGLVFAVLYKLAITSSCRHDMAAQWHEKYLEHMESVHGDTDHHE